MVKCILLVDKDSKFVLACLPGDAQLDTKKVQTLVGSRRLSFATKEQIKEALGYEIGAISPLPPPEKIPAEFSWPRKSQGDFLWKPNLLVVWDLKLQQKFKVNISSGNPSLGLELNRKELVNLINPKVGDISG